MFSGRRPGVMNIPARDQTTPARAPLLLLGPRSRGGGVGWGVAWGTTAEPGPDQIHGEGGWGEGRRRMREATTVAGSGFDGGT